MVALRIVEQEEDTEQRAEERKEAQTMQRMLMSMLTCNNQQLQAPTSHVTQPDNHNNSLNNDDEKQA